MLLNRHYDYRVSSLGSVDL